MPPIRRSPPPPLPPPSPSPGRLIAGIALGIGVVLVALAVVANDDYERKTVKLQQVQQQQKKTGKQLANDPALSPEDRGRALQLARGMPAEIEIASLQEQQDEDLQVLYGAALATTAVFGIGATILYFRYRCRTRGGPSGRTGSRESAWSFGLVGAVAPALVFYHITLSDSVSTGMLIGFGISLVGLAGVSTAVGYFVGRGNEASGLLAIWTVIGLAVVVCVYAESAEVGGIFVGRGRSLLTAQAYGLAVAALWATATAAVLAGATLVRKKGRVPVPGRRAPDVTSLRW